jgi:hypothetical protein
VELETDLLLTRLRSLKKDPSLVSQPTLRTLEPLQSTEDKEQLEESISCTWLA